MTIINGTSMNGYVVNGKTVVNGHVGYTWASPEVKALSANRSNPAYRHLTEAADRGQQIQLSLRGKAPKLFPEFEARRLLDYFLAWTQEMDSAHIGLAVVNEFATDLGDVVPPWNFAWTENYILDPSVPPVSALPEPEYINGSQVTDQGRVLEGCSCEDDICIPETCECFMRAIRRYPNAQSWYARQYDAFTRNPRDPLKKLRFAYSADGSGTLVDNIDIGTPIFECNHACACNKDLCVNRVVQRGRKVPLAFMKTQDKGWGIQALADIPGGTFLGVYGGELLSDDASEIRASTYDNQLGVSYLQNLDSHVVRLFFTQRIVEEDLAAQSRLEDYRGSEERQHKLAKCITRANSLIEGHDDYAKGERKIKEVISMMEAQNINVTGEEARLKHEWHASLRAHNANSHFPENQDIVDYMDLEPSQQEQVRLWSMRQSNMEDQYALIVDAGLFGNFTRFFNHSCDPNIVQFPVYADEPSILRPRLAFFTCRPIKQGEEVCFNYYSGSSAEDDTPVQVDYVQSGHAPTRIRVSSVGSTKSVHALSQHPTSSIAICKCGAPNCRGEVFALST